MRPWTVLDMFDCVLFLVWNAEDLDTLKDTFLRKKRGKCDITEKKEN